MVIGRRLVGASAEWATTGLSCPADAMCPSTPDDGRPYVTPATASRRLTSPRSKGA